MAVVVDRLSDVIPDRASPILSQLRGGIVLWDANLTCHYVSESFNEILGVGADKDRVTSAHWLLEADSMRSGHFQKEFQTPQGAKYLDTTVQPVVNKAHEVLGYMAIYQDITEHQEPIQFQAKLIELLRCVTKGETPTQSAQAMARCASLLGFSHMRLILHKNNLLQTFCQIENGLSVMVTASWEDSLRYNQNNILVKMARDFQRGQTLMPMVCYKSDDLLHGNLSHDDFIVLPIIDSHDLLGFMVLSHHHFTITQDLLAPQGRLSHFAIEMAPVFKRMFFHNPNSPLIDEALLLRTKLESFNLNQKQIRILEMLSRGESNKGIAEVVHLSEQGVKYHVGNLLEKFQSKNRLELRSKLHQILRSH